MKSKIPNHVIVVVVLILATTINMIDANLIHRQQPNNDIIITTMVMMMIATSSSAQQFLLERIAQTGNITRGASFTAGDDYDFDDVMGDRYGRDDDVDDADWRSNKSFFPQNDFRVKTSDKTYHAERSRYHGNSRYNNNSNKQNSEIKRRDSYDDRNRKSLVARRIATKTIKNNNNNSNNNNSNNNNSNNNNSNNNNNDNNNNNRGAHVIRKNLSPSLDEQISKMFAMKMMVQTQQHNDNNNNNYNNNNNNYYNKNHENNNKNKNSYNREVDDKLLQSNQRVQEEDPILEKIFSIDWNNSDTNNNKNISSATTTTSSIEGVPGIEHDLQRSTVHGDILPGNELPTTVLDHNQDHQIDDHHHHHHEEQQQPQADNHSSRDYDNLEQHLFEMKSSLSSSSSSSSTFNTPVSPITSVPSERKSSLNYRHVSHTHNSNHPNNHHGNQTGKMKRRLPQAIIIGVKKAGTRALLEFLKRHPMVRGAGPEVHFFDKNYQKGLDWYRSKMPPSLEEHLTIEKTPGYYMDKMSPMRVKKMNNRTKLLIVVRNPVDRLISHYAQRHSRKPNMSKFEMTVVKNYPNRKLMYVDESRESVQQGLYAKHLYRWLKYFPKDQIAIVDGDNLVSNPYEEISKLESFLNLPTFYTPHNFVPNASRGFSCFRSFNENMNEDCNNSTTNPCLDSSLDDDDEYDDDDDDDDDLYDKQGWRRTTTIITTENRKSPQLRKGYRHHQGHNRQQDSNPPQLSYGNAYHLLSLPNASMYFPNQVLPLQPSSSSSALSSSSLSPSSSSSSSSSQESPYFVKRKKRNFSHHSSHQADLERSRKEKSLPIEETTRDDRRHDQRRSMKRFVNQFKQHRQNTSTNNKLHNRKQQQKQNKRTKTTITIVPTSNPNERIYCLNEGKGRVHPKVNREVITLLSDFYRPHNEKFFRLIGRRFNWSRVES